ncbi:DUF4352 domain-containing protein [Alkalibacterium gilvum]|uniref:DUF4352 domain-containing protein n=1 Tax=Alkalibacterium gilvum TaxID=1130080 RepID=UPI003F8DB4ED
MGNLLFILWVGFSLAFIIMLIITIVKAVTKQKVKTSLISTGILFGAGLLCFIGGIASVPSNDDDYTVEKNDSTEISDADTTVEDSDEDSNEKKELSLGETLKVGGAEVTVTNAEFVQSDNEYSTPEKGNILKVSYKFKNNGEERFLATDDVFNLTVDNETQKNFFGMDDTNDGFSEFLNTNNTVSGYTYFDVPDAEEYKAEMNFDPHLETYKADWIIKKSDIS